MVKITSCLLLNVFVVDDDYHTHGIFVSALKDDKARKEVLVVGKFCGYKSLVLATGQWS